MSRRRHYYLQMIMNRFITLTIGLVLASAGIANADDEAPKIPERAKPFLTGEEDNVITVTGAFGPAADTMMVFTCRTMVSNGAIDGFALVADPKAKNGQHKIALPKLPQGCESTQMQAILVANLDKDADDEVVVGFRVFRTAGGRQGGFSYNTWEYAVLDWAGKKFVRLPALEKKLATKADARENKSSVLSEEDARAALGLAKK
jgi:hypothetical protein